MVNEASSEWASTAPTVITAAGADVMDSPVTWTMLAVFIAAVLTTGGIVWGVAEYLKRHRHELRSSYDHKFEVLDGAIDLLKESFDKRIETMREAANARLQALENHKAELGVLLKQMENNQRRTEEEFRLLRDERKDDMAALHKRLEGFDDRFAQLVRGVKYITPDPAG